MTNLRQLEQRLKKLERQVNGHHQHGTIASRLAKLEDTVTGDPREPSSITQRLDEIEAKYRGDDASSSLDADDASAPPLTDETADPEPLLDDTPEATIDQRIELVEQRLDDVVRQADDDTDVETLLAALDRIESRLLALERERSERE